MSSSRNPIESGWQSGDDEGPGRPTSTAPVNQGEDGLHHGTGRTDRVHTGPGAHAQDGRPADGDDGRPRRGDAAPTTAGSELKKAPFVDPLTMQEDIVWLTAKVELREEDPLVREALKTMPEDWFLRFVRGAMYEADAAARVKLVKKAITRSVVLVDCSGLTWKDFRTAINHGLGSIFNMWARHYPSTLQALYLLHCPVVVKALFRAVRAWIEPDTLPKITLLSDPVHENEKVSEEEECRKMRDTRCLGFGFKKIEGSRLSSRDVGNGSDDDGGGGGNDDDDDEDEEEAKDAESSASEGCSSPRIRRLLSLVTASPRTGDSFHSSWKLFSPGRAQQARKEPTLSPSPRLPSLAEASDSLWPLRGKTIDLIMWEDHAVTFAFVFSSHLILGTLRVLSADIVILSAFAFWGVWSAIWASEAVRCLCPSLYLLSSDLSAAWASVLFDMGECFSSIVSILDQTMQNSRRNDDFVKVSAFIVFALLAVNLVDIIFIAHGALIAIFFIPSMLKVLIF
ncbi:Phosphatidylinositol/phosphatidylcholine transfer protein SFH1 [Hondaea fermentalgiana]|uniref:Phosphatidylinositol/phosphatidylcholine transfer protein SFH1 n=1 Tax=Hondaea fermentalgiana TaxID=2315210 RepID=A0A2R5G988_9STRA|nr:Phosphatidylinositol/phosphatidylcholine transfer protein SFH1 [Hondaea fermentalgiana]|eukprot:GBG24244.1 Phosphatidylinositol/phosphatidylcholine transfer protein SFH1 [Hondaea fermentalgiana]